MTLKTDLGTVNMSLANARHWLEQAMKLSLWSYTRELELGKLTAAKEIIEAVHESVKEAVHESVKNDIPR